MNLAHPMLDFSRIRFITFDCYGTLIDWETGLLRCLRSVFDAHRAQLSDSDTLKLYGELEAEAEASEYRSYREVLCQVVRSFGERLGFQATRAEQDSLPESIANWLPFPDTIGALRTLKSKFQLGILSNIDDDLFAATALKLEVPFDFVVTAAHAHAYKPSHRVFHLAQYRMKINNDQWLHAAQSIYHDVIPASALGMSTAWVNRPSLRPGSGAAKAASAAPDIEVASLAELAKLTANF